ncbi:hypothetical protein NHQ30_004166 [Ciborinia camelliae]|nr:hypothetical protein NHQ30_004166 [Ciborinia camelliae]
MDPHRNDSAESSNDQREAPAETQEGATVTQGAAENTDPAPNQSPTSHRRSHSSPVLPHQWAPQPVHPPFSIAPPNQLQWNIFQRRGPHLHAPLRGSQIYPSSPGSTEPNHGFSPGFYQGVGTGVAAGGGMETLFGPDPSRNQPKRRYTKRQPKSGTTPTPSAKSSGVKKSKQPSSQSSDRSMLGSESTAANLERIARNLTAAVANVQALLAEVVALVAQEAAREAASNAVNAAAAAAIPEDSAGEEEEEDAVGPSSS